MCAETRYKDFEMEHALKALKKRLENDFCVYVQAKLSNLDDFQSSPFVRKQNWLKSKNERAERLKSILS